MGYHSGSIGGFSQTEAARRSVFFGGTTLPARIGLFGTSQAANNHSAGSYTAGVPAALQAPATREDKSSQGFAVYLEMLTGGRVELPRSLNYGIAAENSDAMVARLDQAVAAMAAGGASAVICLCFANDGGKTLAAMQANAVAIEAAFLRAGIAVIWISEYPRGNAANTAYAYAGATLERHLALHRWLHGRRVFAVNAWGAVGDPASANGYLATGLSADYLHLEGQGNYRVAAAIAPLIEQLYPSRSLLPSCAADVWSANHPQGAINLNPLLLGTGGTVAAGNAGQIADNWVNPATAAGVVATFSKSSDGEGFPVQRIALAGTSGAADNQFVELLRRDTAVGSALAVGGMVKAAADLTLDPASTGIKAAWIQVGAGGNSARAPSPSTTIGNSQVPAEGFGGVVELPAIAIAENATTIRLSLWVMLKGSADVSAGLGIKRFALLGG